MLGSGYFEWLGEHPAEAAIFNRAMAAGSALKLRSLEQLAWSDELVVDVGGGTGGLISGLLANHPALRGIVVDLPHSEAVARATFERAGVADRCSVRERELLRGGAVGRRRVRALAHPPRLGRRACAAHPARHPRPQRATRRGS